MDLVIEGVRPVHAWTTILITYKVFDILYRALMVGYSVVIINRIRI